MVSINIIQGKMYNIIKKITIVVVALTFFSIVFFTITLIWWRGDYSWEDMQLEYVGQMSYQYPGAVQELGIPPITVNAYNIKRVLETPEDDKIRNFFQIRSKADWEYVKEVLGVKQNELKLSFKDSEYYIISINQELEKVEYNKNDWTIEKYGHTVRGQNKDNSYHLGEIFIYKIGNEIVFYYEY